MILTIIPYKEGYDRNDLGSISLTVSDFYERSAYKEELVILGAKPTKNPLSDGYYVVPVKRQLLESESHAYMRGCLDYIKRMRPRVIELHNRPAWAHYLFENTHIPLALYLHNDPQEMKSAQKVSQRAKLLNKCAAIYCVSDFVRKRFIEGLESHPNAKKVKVIYNFVEQPKSTNFSHKQNFILFVGRLVKEKGIIEFTESMKDVIPANPGWKVVIIGARQGNKFFDPCYKAVSNLVAKFPDRVIYYPKCTHEDTLSWFNYASIAVLPSILNEPFGTTMLESLSKGCALITTKKGAIPEVVGDAAILLDRITPEFISYSVNDLINNPSRMVNYQYKATTQASIFNHNFESVHKLDESRKDILAA